VCRFRSKGIRVKVQGLRPAAGKRMNRGSLCSVLKRASETVIPSWLTPPFPALRGGAASAGVLSIFVVGVGLGTAPCRVLLLFARVRYVAEGRGMSAPFVGGGGFAFSFQSQYSVRPSCQSQSSALSSCGRFREKSNSGTAKGPSVHAPSS